MHRLPNIRSLEGGEGGVWLRGGGRGGRGGQGNSEKGNWVGRGEGGEKYQIS